MSEELQAAEEQGQENEYDKAFDERMVELSGEGEPDQEVVPDQQEETAQPDTDEPEQPDRQEEVREESKAPTLEELLEENKKLQNSVLSMAGRASKADKERNALREQLQGFTAPQKTTLPVIDDEGGFGEGWNELKQEYEGLGKIEEIIKAQNQQIQALTGEIGNTRQTILAQRANDDFKSKVAALEESHPGYRDIVKSESFKQWTQELKPDMQALVQKSTDPQVASAFLSTYKSEMLARNQRVESVTAKRNKQLADSLTVESKRVAPRTDKGSATYDEAFDYAMKSISKHGKII